MVETTAEISHTKFRHIQSGNELRFEIDEYLSGLQKKLYKAISTGVELSDSKEISRLYSPDILDIILNSYKGNNGGVLCVRNMILENVIKLNTTSGFSSLVSTLFAIEAVKNTWYNHTTSINNNNTIKLLSHASRRASKSIAFSTIKQYCKDPLSSSIIIQACSMTGHNGTIYIDSTPGTENSLELTNGYTFKFGIENNFASSCKTKEWKKDKPYVLLIDGTIETVGEINRILEYFYENKVPCVIMARGFSSEVLGTLSVNKARETLDVIPVLVPFDLEGINALVDLAKVCGTGIVSSLKGDAISAINPEELITVDKITLNKSSLVIQNSSTVNAVRTHLKNIVEKKNETNVQDKKDLLDKRTRSLSSVCTHIKIAKNDSKSKLTKTRIKHGINMFKQICRFGCIELDRVLKNKRIDQHTLAVLKKLNNLGFEHVSANEFILGIKCGTSIANNIFSSSVYLVLDEDNR